jgi:hypothetical protein
MKTAVLIFVFIFPFGFYGQRDSIDEMNLKKVAEVRNMVETKLNGTVTEQDVLDFTAFIWNARSTFIPFQYFDLLNPDLYGLNEDPNQEVDLTYLNQAFTQLKNKKNVRVEFIELYDYYDFYDNAHKKSDYLISYRIHFVNDTSFGENTENYVDLRIDVINGYVTSLFHVLAKV